MHLFLKLLWASFLLGVISSGRAQDKAFVQKLQKTYQAADNDSLRAVITMRISGAYCRTQPDSAILYAQKALRLVEESQLDALSGYAYYAMGIPYYYQGDYEQATTWYYKALHAFEKQKNKDGEAKVANALGNIFRKQGQDDKALLYFEKSLEKCREIDNHSGVGMVLDNIALIYYRREDYPKAQQYFEEAYQIALEQKNLSSQAAILNNLGLLYKRKESYQQALQHFQKAVQIRKQLKDDLYNLGGYYINIAQTYQALQNPDSSLFYAHKGLQIAQQVEASLNLAEAYETLAKSYALQGRYDSAYRYQERYQQLFAQLSDQEKNEKINELELKYQSLQKEKRISELEKETKLQALQARQSYLWLLLSIAISLSLLVISYLVYRQYQVKRRDNILLKAQKKVLNQQQDEILQQKTLIQDTLRQKETLYEEMQHRTKNNLNILYSLLNLQMNRLQDKNIRQILANNRGQVEAVRLLHQALYHRSSSEPIALKPYLENLLEEINLLVPPQQAIDLRLEAEDIHLDAQQIIPLGLIVNEAITNALKYAFPEGRAGSVWVRLSLLNSEAPPMLCLSIADNGVGFAGESALKSNSLGLGLIKNLSTQLQGKLTIKSEPGQGCILSIVFPAVLALEPAY